MFNNSMNYFGFILITFIIVFIKLEDAIFTEDNLKFTLIIIRIVYLCVLLRFRLYNPIIKNSL